MRPKSTAFVDAFADPSLTFERAALVVGHELESSVDVSGTLVAIDRLAEPLVTRFPARPDPETSAAALERYLGIELGFRGNSEDYYTPENSLLDRVLARKLGIPITLAVLYIAVGRRAGFVVDGIGFPGHFLIRVGGDGGVFQDPFHRGRLLDSIRLGELSAQHVAPEATVDPRHLAPVSPRAVAIRMLTNLEAAYARRNEHPRAWVAADRLHALSGDDVHRRNRGLHALAMGSNALAAEDLGAYLEAHPDAPDLERMNALVVRARSAGKGGSLN